MDVCVSMCLCGRGGDDGPHTRQERNDHWPDT